MILLTNVSFSTATGQNTSGLGATPFVKLSPTRRYQRGHQRGEQL